MNEDDGLAVALVDVSEPQAVDLAVARLVVEPRQRLEALVGSSEGVAHRARTL